MYKCIFNGFLKGNPVPNGREIIQEVASIEEAERMAGNILQWYTGRLVDEIKITVTVDMVIDPLNGKPTAKKHY